MSFPVMYLYCTCVFTVCQVSSWDCKYTGLACFLSLCWARSFLPFCVARPIGGRYDWGKRIWKLLGNVIKHQNHKSAPVFLWWGYDTDVKNTHRSGIRVSIMKSCNAKENRSILRCFLLITSQKTARTKLHTNLYPCVTFLNASLDWFWICDL